MAAYSGQAHDRGRRLDAIPERRSLDSSLRSAVAEQLGETRFSLWFGDGVQLRLSGEGEALDVRVPNAFFREWIKGHFAPNLIAAARAVTGRDVRLSFSIQDEADPPLTEVVEPEDERSRQWPGGTVIV